MTKLTGIFFLLLFVHAKAQLSVGNDTIRVMENGYVLKMPWANGLNYATFSNVDVNYDNVKDLVAFDKINQFGVGRFRCFIKTGAAGVATYTYNPGLSYAFPQVANWATFVDYNCDGKEDLFCSASGGIMVYTNIGSLSSGLSFSLTSPLLYTYYNPSPSGYANLYAGPSGVPGLADVDNDGDIDVLTFSPQGVFVEFHQNMSKEAFGNCNSLDTFNLNTACWGKIIENNCSVALSQTCAMRPWPDYHPELQDNLHSGSCLTCIDYDNDQDVDLIMGDISCNNVQFAYNSGTSGNAVITDTTKLYPNYPNKGSTLQIKMNNFPCTYNVDVDGDGKKDLIATPNTFGSENAKSTWYYKNTSPTNTVNFQFVKNNFLQDEMIEVGQNSYPVLFDYNADGKKDLLIGTFGYYGTGTLKAQLALYENTGTLAQPSYSLITKDYAGVSTQSLNYAMPTVGDIDSDGDTDILIGTSNGKIHWLKNTAGPGSVCTFTFINNPFGFTTLSAVAAPQLFDINKDGLLDLMIGGKNGQIAYYKNTGTSLNAVFTKKSNFFGSVNVKGDPNLYGIDGYASPFFYDEGPQTKLLTGSVSGQIFYYTIPVLTSDSCVAVLINNSTNYINEGAQSTVWYEDVNSDGKRDLFVGNAGGGLNFFSSKSPFVGIEEKESIESLVNVFPVPAQEELIISVNKIDAKKIYVLLTDVLGKQVLEASFVSNNGIIYIADLNPGIYFASIVIYSDHNNFRIVKKIIKN
ncbi:MAG: T9SS type A sorting domain-containing protein [Bacteroidetes bacterium]|nr:T9SS type A sorting domain-containing protein [Bacteroidota bacterium]